MRTIGDSRSYGCHPRVGLRAAVVVAAALGWAQAARANAICDPAAPCSFQIQDQQIQPVPGIFKLQARISQAKLPVGDAVFASLTVKVVKDTQTLCMESFSNVQVKNGVLNLEIGHNMSCQLEEVIAQNNGLAFQICIGDSRNCLKPIALGSTPYAVKSSFAATAQQTHKADVAATSHYAQRATADRDLWVNNELGKGYFDFYTPPQGGSVYGSEETFAPYREGGFIRWTPVSAQGPTLNICAGDLATDELEPLSELVFDSVQTTARGNATVEGALTVVQRTKAEGGLEIPQGGGNGTKELACYGDAQFGAPDEAIPSWLDIYSTTEFHGDVIVHGPISGSVANGSIGSEQLRTGAVTTEKIAMGAVGSDQILDGSIDSTDIAANAITAGKIAPGAIIGVNIGAGVIAGDRIASETITGANILDSSVTASDIADNAITGAKIANGAITGSHIEVPLAVGSVYIGSDNRVGIGTSTPADPLGSGAALDVKGCVSSARYYDSNSSYYADLDSGGHLGGNWQVDGGMTVGSSVTVGGGVYGSGQMQVRSGGSNNMFVDSGPSGGSLLLNWYSPGTVYFGGGTQSTKAWVDRAGNAGFAGGLQASGGTPIYEAADGTLTLMSTSSCGCVCSKYGCSCSTCYNPLVGRLVAP